MARGSCCSDTLHEQVMIGYLPGRLIIHAFSRVSGVWWCCNDEAARILIRHQALCSSQPTAMSMECSLRIFLPLCVSLFSLLAASGVVADGNVTLQSLTIFNTHEWFDQKPEVYFQCQGEDKVYLPDIQAKDQVYNFLGLESWQPLVTLVGKKCKRCGLYEKDAVKADDVFDQWELCPLDFSPSPEGLYSRLKDKEFSLALSCPNCKIVSSEDAADSESAGESDEKEESHHHGLTAVIVIFVFLSLGGFGFVAYSQWRRKQRETQQARFIKLFEDEDFLDDELGLKDGL